MAFDESRVIAENVDRVRATIDEAARASGRRGADVTLVAVTKYVGLNEVRAVLDAGCRDLGESRPQELWSKSEGIGTEPFDPAVRWHLVGHLQRNKVSRTVPLVCLIHSVDSISLMQSIDQRARQQSRTTSILLEVNISGESAKHGLAPGEVAPLLECASEYPHVRVVGLMAMAALEGGRDRAGRDFSHLRQLRDRLQGNCPPEVSLTELSMGMSRDYDLAIAEGATIVRVGSTLFEGLSR